VCRTGLPRKIPCSRKQGSQRNNSDQVHDIGSGGLVVIPSNVTHWGEVIGDEPVINLDVFTPKRPEYAP
jgi:quercetin dioxygenase-like cupin family protein